MENLSRITDQNFKEILENNKYILVLFSTAECGYCQIAKKNVLQIANQLQAVTIYQCLLSEAPETFDSYSITSVPVVKLFKDQEVVYTGFGVRESSDLYYQLKSFLPTPEYYDWPEE